MNEGKSSRQRSRCMGVQLGKEREGGLKTGF